jgi:hypothetical protein
MSELLLGNKTEALRTAQRTGGRLQRKCDCGQHTVGGSQCNECGKKRPSLQRATQNTETGIRDSGGIPPIVNQVLRSPGQPLNAQTLAYVEPRFGHDFSRVRVHTDGKAAESARAVNASAYTVGRDVVFGANQYAPTTSAGRALLIHELVHAVQQSSVATSSVDELSVSERHDTSEQQADEAAKMITETRPCAINRNLPAKIARQESSDTPLDSPGLTASTGRPVFFCSKSVAFGQSHAFFRVGGSGPGNSTFELEHDEYGEHCQCGIQGWPTRDYPEDRDAADAPCVPAPMITESCLLNNWSSYPVGKYCALGPNSNTYARFVAERCGAVGLRPPGRLPGFNDAPPTNHTANPALDARATILPGGCQTIDCDDDVCRRIYF